MTTFGPYETQKRLFEILSGDATLTGLITGIFDNVPDSQAFPFVTIGDAEWNDRGNHTHQGLAGKLTIHVWARERGRKTALAIQKRIDELLHEAEPNVTGWVNVSFRRDMSTVVVDDDNVTYHGIQIFNLFIGEEKT